MTNNELIAQDNSSSFNNNSNNVVMIGNQSDTANQCQGIYISPNVVKRKITPKKKAIGKDLRYQMKDLEKASLMTGDDFLNNKDVFTRTNNNATSTE